MSQREYLVSFDSPLIDFVVLDIVVVSVFMVVCRIPITFHQLSSRVERRSSALGDQWSIYDLTFVLDHTRLQRPAVHLQWMFGSWVVFNQLFFGCQPSRIRSGIEPNSLLLFSSRSIGCVDNLLRNMSTVIDLLSIVVDNIVMGHLTIVVCWINGNGWIWSLGHWLTRSDAQDR